jgi:hypothetical protein
MENGFHFCPLTLLLLNLEYTGNPKLVTGNHFFI